MRARRLVCDGGDCVDRRLGLGPGSMNASNGSGEEEFARRLHQRRQRTVRVFRQELLGSELPLVPRALQLLDQLMQSVGACDVHAVAYARIAVRTSGDKHRVHLAVGAVLVVAAQVASVGSCLVEVGLLWFGLALQLKDDDGAADQEDDVWAARLER